MNMVKSLFLAGILAFTPGSVSAQSAAPTPQAVGAAPAEAGTESAQAAAPAASVMKPTEGIGMPQSGETTFQEQFADNGRYALWFHDSVLLPIITAISLFVLGLLIWVMFRYRRSANPVPSKTSHNTLIEVIWTLVPVLILVGIAIPSIDLLARQYKPAPENALTVKVTGYQWYWGYEYPDNGISEIISNMLSNEEARKRGEPELLGVDNRLVLPAGRPIKLLITGADVIHSFSVPAFWIKEDAVPGRINEKGFIIDKPGIYYGQCSELCGARHGFMPIAVEALPPAEFDAWVLAQGGHARGAAEAPAEAVAAAAPAANAVQPATATN
ncbi:cytochrome c oxidase subunit II [Rhizorhapis sp. SPR117]|uniref:cytochrome c oxidase subunit II n=1 Tax=Rhizorhapis sp. SPR117 TaxID=2912611 RepID=UPI001F03259B|nr:cytochrome c oxidase subunit II [Rhizorhapis sp. SPR117]